MTGKTISTTITQTVTLGSSSYPGPLTPGIVERNAKMPSIITKVSSAAK